MKQLFLALSLFCSVFAQAQRNDNIYRSENNPHYWQNRKPHATYWQQDVHYRINAGIDEKTRIIHATEELTYWNNSPNTLTEVYFHLYQNAFVKGSHLEELQAINDAKVRRMGKYQQAGLGTRVSFVKVDGKAVEPIFDQTIMKVVLPKPLKPGESIEFSMHFNTYFDQGDFRRRMAVYNSWGFPHFNGVHWYPRIAVYDAKKGWDTDQHLNKELYGDYGLFDVKLTFASNYIVEATGALQNQQEMLPDDLRKKLDVKNFANKPWNEKPSVIIPYDSSQRKTWHFVANNVHDFAFTADPHYRIGEAYWNGIQCVGLALEPHASKWQNSAEYVAKIIQTFSTDFGMYVYPKMVAADANDGMEYPMLTLDGGGDPGYRGLLVHEIGHNWFYGMIGNNETYRAALDEGFTQFLTAWGLNKIDGPIMVEEKDKNKYKAKHREPKPVLDRNVYSRYMFDAMRHEDVRLNTHSDDFNNALGHENGYSNVYHKTATMLYNLQYVLGDSLFLAAMQHYVAQWKIAHPYFEDFRASIIQFTQQDLNWFFDQWMETTKHIDYGIRSIKKTNNPNEYALRFKRKGDMTMPLDVQVQAKDGKTYNYLIPNTYSTKPGTAKVLPQWFGWGALYPSYTATVQIPSGIRSVSIDPTHRLADIDMLNNTRKAKQLLPCASTQVRWENYINNPSTWHFHSAKVRPDVWWNQVDGLKLGFHGEGSQHNIRRKWYATVWLNTRLLSKLDYRAFEGENWFKGISPIDYTFRYEDILLKVNPKISWGLDSRYLEGLSRNQVYMRYNVRDKQSITLSATALFRNGAQAHNYLLFGNEWSSYRNAGTRNSDPNIYVQADWKKQYSYYRGFGRHQITFRSPITYNYAYVQGEQINTHRLHKLDVRSRVVARFGTGNSLPNESALFMQGANPEEMMENKFNRSQGIVPLTWGGMATNAFAEWHSGGGLNLRGYNGYYAIDQNNAGTIYTNYKGRSGAAINLEVDVDNYFSKIRPKYLRDYLHLDVYAFADAGVMSRGVYDATNITALQPFNAWSRVRMDAGIGTAWTIKKFGPFEKMAPFTLRFDMPFFLSSTPYAKPEQLAWRWVMGVNRAF